MNCVSYFYTSFVLKILNKNGVCVGRFIETTCTQRCYYFDGLFHINGQYFAIYTVTLHCI